MHPQITLLYQEHKAHSSPLTVQHLGKNWVQLKLDRELYFHLKILHSALEEPFKQFALSIALGTVSMKITKLVQVLANLVPFKEMYHTLYQWNYKIKNKFQQLYRKVSLTPKASLTIAKTTSVTNHLGKLFNIYFINLLLAINILLNTCKLLSQPNARKRSQL